ncbi:MAG: rhomboid family intramembrane serine protease [Promethearchaeia archaeon]
MFILDADSIKKATLTKSLLLINILCFIAINLFLGYTYVLFFSQINYEITINGEYWRLFTSMFLHADIIHLASNMIALLIFGTAVEINYKSKTQYLLIYFISGFIGNFFTLILLPSDTISLGASGAIFGLIGAAFILYARFDPTLLILSLFYILYFILASFAPGINVIAHLTGLIGGIILGLLFYRKNKDFNY